MLLQGLDAASDEADWVHVGAEFADAASPKAVRAKKLAVDTNTAEVAAHSVESFSASSADSVSAANFVSDVCIVSSDICATQSGSQLSSANSDLAFGTEVPSEASYFAPSAEPSDTGVNDVPFHSPTSAMWLSHRHPGSPVAKAFDDAARGLAGVQNNDSRTANDTCENIGDGQLGGNFNCIGQFDRHRNYSKYGLPLAVSLLAVGITWWVWSDTWGLQANKDGNQD